MSDYRNVPYRSLNDPMLGNSGYEPAVSRINWGWIAGAVVLLFIFGLAFGVGHEPNRVASNSDVTSPAATHMARPATGANPAAPPAAPSLTPPPASAPASTPNRP